MSHLSDGDGIVDLLAEVTANIVSTIDYSGDGPIPGAFNWLVGDGVELNVWNSNNHQTTWSVRGAALSALKDYMRKIFYGAAFFKDVANEVGQRVIG